MKQIYLVSVISAIKEWKIHVLPFVIFAYSKGEYTIHFAINTKYWQFIRQQDRGK